MDSHPWEMLNSAAERGNLALIEILFSAVPEFKENINTKGQATLIGMLLQYYACEFTIIAAIRGGHAAIVGFLMDNGALIDRSLDKVQNLTALHFAASTR